MFQLVMSRDAGSRGRGPGPAAHLESAGHRRRQRHKSVTPCDHHILHAVHGVGYRKAAEICLPVHVCVCFTLRLPASATNGAVVYSLLENGGVFDISPSTGFLSLTATLDKETTPRYTTQSETHKVH